MQKLIQIANMYGSKAKTTDGALKFLEKNKANLFKKIIRDYPNLYKTSNSSWAGGNHKTTVIIADKPLCNGGSERVWSSNGKWSGNDSYATLRVTRRALIALDGELLIGGLITLDAEKVGNREYKAVWAEQARGFDLKSVEGWIIKGHHIRGGTLEAARKKVEKIRSQQVEKALLIRERKNNKKAELKNLKNVWVCVDDSIKSGNCIPGTESMASIIRSKLGNVEAVRADILLSIRDDYYTRKAVNQAKSR